MLVLSSYMLKCTAFHSNIYLFLHTRSELSQRLMELRVAVMFILFVYVAVFLAGTKIS